MIKYRKEVEGLRPYIPGKSIDEVKQAYGLTHIVKLASNENPLGCSELAKQSIIESLNEPSYYPDGNCTALRAKLAKKYNLSPNQLIFGAGSDEIINMITKTYVSKNDEVITGDITFPQYKAGTLQMGGKIIEVPLKSYIFDLDGILAHITDQTRIIFIANPNNPTGTMVNAAAQLNFLNRVPKDILVVMDEAYVEYIRDSDFPQTIPLLHEYPNLMVLRTFSKMYGLASMRIGYGIADADIIEKINRVRGPFNVTTAAQVAAQAALDDEAFVQRTYEVNEASKAYTYNRCHQLKLSYIETFGNFVMIDFGRPSPEMFEALQSEGYIVRPGHNLGMPGFQRVTLGTPEQMEAFFNVVEGILKG
ncbi:histidinol-phosphate transaminase [Petrocella sp. FN5]|uniref:histidinol-phosphate transaminase n=1 Tax=Petrocella sp. FN5 TaxID=3032002 RepID=UPI0023DC06F7|nr:histidinol-phosphate transaminase [Petrocella sp. FN5]MDF1616256.1 histidinol-phosphate transaminase [Petrocella sp. FN5]